MLRNFVQSGISESVLCRLSWWHSWAFFIVEWSVVVLKMFCNFKTINPTIRSLVISEKICLILITLQFWDMIKKGQEEINSSWLNRVLSEIEIPLEGFSESRTKFVRYFGHPLKPREATVRSEVVFCHFCRMKIPAQVFNRTLISSQHRSLGSWKSIMFQKKSPRQRNIFARLQRNSGKLSASLSCAACFRQFGCRKLNRIRA